jgi:hypothetical protein
MKKIIVALVMLLLGGLAALPSATLAQSDRGAAQNRVNVTIRGQGSRVVTIRLTRNSPLVVTASHNGQSNFIVHLVSGGTDVSLFNEIGVYSGQTAVTDIHAGGYRVAVQADGAWTLGFSQPSPPSNAKLIPGRITGHGARVIAIRSTRNMQPVVTAAHRGQSNFIVHLIGYGTTTGEESLFNEIGNYHGQTLINSLPKGSYLLYVQADGTWTIRFTP